MSLKNKIVIFNSDDFGHSEPFNLGIFKGIKSGVLASACILPNLKGYNQALELSKDLANIKFGIHLNIIEGKSLTNSPLLTDGAGNFNLGYVSILKKSCNKDFMQAVEHEFCAQIERIMADFKINHINSHVHVHSIPNIFKLVLRLAKKYKIPYVRTQFEKPYICKAIKPVNLVKLGLLNFLSVKNKKLLTENILTNDYLLGVSYTGCMDENTILAGLKNIPCGLVEILIHPAYHEQQILHSGNYKEFLITQNPIIKEKIRNLGFEYADCSVFEKI